MYIHVPMHMYMYHSTHPHTCMHSKERKKRLHKNLMNMWFVTSLHPAYQTDCYLANISFLEWGHHDSQVHTLPSAFPRPPNPWAKVTYLTAVLQYDPLLKPLDLLPLKPLKKGAHTHTHIPQSASLIALARLIFKQDMASHKSEADSFPYTHILPSLWLPNHFIIQSTHSL